MRKRFVVGWRRASVCVVLGTLLLLGALLGGPLLPALAAGHVSFDGSPGTDAPPTTLGPYWMVRFPPDPRPTGWELVYTVPGPTGDLQFDREVYHANVDADWATWSHGYTGSVYFVWDHEVTITLPPNTFAFYFYAQPNVFADFPITAVADGTSSGPIVVSGDAGATYFGFYSLTDPIVSVTVSTVEAADGFAIGTFAVDGVAPAPDSGRADVSVLIYGGWSGIPVSAWVGGTRQPTLLTAPNHEGEAAVLFTFWPHFGASWRVTVAPSVPAGLDPGRWQMRLLWIETPSGFMRPAGPTVTVGRGSRYTLHYQLIDTGALP